MLENDWNKLSFMQKSYNLRLWLFNKVSQRKIRPHDALQIDEQILRCVFSKNESLLKTLAYKYNFILENKV